VKFPSPPNKLDNQDKLRMMRFASELHTFAVSPLIVEQELDRLLTEMIDLAERIQFYRSKT